MIMLERNTLKPLIKVKAIHNLKMIIHGVFHVTLIKKIKINI